MTHDKSRIRRKEIAAELLAGKSLADIAAKHKCSAGTVWHISTAMGVQQRDENTERNAKIIELASAGLDANAIAGQLGISPPSVRSVCASRGIPIARKQYEPTVNYLGVIAALINTPATLDSIGKKFKITRERVRQIGRASVDAGIMLHPERVLTGTEK